MKKIILSMVALLLGPLSYAQDSTQTTETNVEVDRTEEPKAGGPFVEPYLTYESDDVKIKTSDMPLVANDTTSSSDGFGIGARLGLHVKEIFFLAADARFAQSQLSQSLYDNTRANQYNYGVTAGAQTPLAGLRLWGTYVLGGRMDPSSGENGVDLRFEDLNGYRVGAGLFVRSVSINVEYQNLTFDTTRVQSWGNVAVDSNFDTDTDVQGYTLGLGFPFTL
jgi:hypothetical protein